MPDLDAIADVIKAAAEGEALSAEDLAAALLLTQAVRLNVDLMEAELLDVAHAAGMGWDQIATVLDLPDGTAARRHYERLSDRRDVPTAPAEGRAVPNDALRHRRTASGPVVSGDPAPDTPPVTD